MSISSGVYHGVLGSLQVLYLDAPCTASWDIWTSYLASRLISRVRSGRLARALAFSQLVEPSLYIGKGSSCSSIILIIAWSLGVFR
jgi:hypothetical protein